MLAIAAKEIYLVLVYTEAEKFTKLTFNYLTTIQILSLCFLCGALGIELMIWISYYERIRGAGKTIGQSKFIQRLKSR